MKKTHRLNQKLVFAFLILIKALNLRADEGMLIPSLIAAFESDMKAKGMKLTAEDIYSINKASLKDAIFQFGGGCTAELVSSKGLLLTNHHCGYSQIQSHSSLEKDYLKNGFWAKTLTEELPNPGLIAVRIVRIEDVTALVLNGASSKDDKSTIQSNIQKIISEVVANSGYEAEVKAFNYGNDYYMMVKEIFTDIRFVGTPPNSIGKFGGDTDNWVWPRHTGDFSVFRIYAGKDNKPAAYSKENVPYTPIRYLNISFRDRKEGDFTMVYGFPGQTEQHVVSSYLKFIIEKERPARIHMRDLSLGVIDAAMKASDLTRIQYAAKQASIANAWKKWIGQIDGLRTQDAVMLKQNKESEYTKLANSKEEWKKYASVVYEMNALVERDINWEFKYAMGVEYFSYGPEYFKLARAVNDLVSNYQKYKTSGELNTVLERLKVGADGFFKNYDASVDKEIFNKLTKEYFSNTDQWEGIKKELMYSTTPDWCDNYIKSISDRIYTKSVLTDKERYLNFLQNFNDKSIKKLDKDVGLQHYTAHITPFRNYVIPAYQNFSNNMSTLLQTYVEGKKIMSPNAKHWPDANSTLRITYGKLEGSTPTDGMKYTEHTTLEGMIAKYHSGNADFELQPRMLELFKQKNYGNYAQNGQLWVCFTGSNHTTGGNSGSPVLDENGNLMGLNFDRTWESTMSDYLFDSARCRNVVVDIRYVLWVMDIYSGARHLVDEMVLVKE
ncbi:MAG: S46 family peptidase [Bacteroidetes bacterium]|nr:S46 family peptidase [Bacteroidota bacterium]